MDYFNRHNLQKNLYWFEKTFQKMIIKELGNSDVSALSMESVATDYEVCEL